MNIKTLILSIALFFTPGAFAQGSDFDAGFPMDISSVQVDLPQPVPETVPDEDEKSGEAGGDGGFVFAAEEFPGYYNADGQNKDPYNMPEILRDIPAMWKEHGLVFKKVAVDRKMDPYALAAYCVFESYNEKTHRFNARHLDGVASGIASTQANDVKGGKVPGLDVRLPKSISETKTVLRNNPEYGIRFLAEEFKAWYYGGEYFLKYYGPELHRKLFGNTDFQGYRDLAKSFPRVALPGWTDAKKQKGNYGTQAQYVSRAYSLYKAFKTADGK